MNANEQRLEPPDLRYYHQNRDKMPPETLVPYAGQFVAFSPDGTRILASGGDMAEVESKLRALGIAPSQVVGSYIPPCDQAIL